MDFLVNGFPKDVLAQLEGHMARQGFGVPAWHRTETTMVFTRSVLRPFTFGERIMKLLGYLVLFEFLFPTEQPRNTYRVRAVATDEGKERTRLTITGNRPEDQQIAEQFVAKEMGRTPWIG